MNAVTSIIRNLPRFDGTKPENYRDRCSKTRVVLSLSNQDVFSVLNGLTEPISAFADTTTPDVPTNSAEVSRWTRACENLFSILYLITGGPAAALVRQYKDRKTVGGLGNGQKAWNAFYAKYHNNSNEARRACYKNVDFRMEQGQNPDDYTFKLLEVVTS